MRVPIHFYSTALGIETLIYHLMDLVNQLCCQLHKNHCDRPTRILPSRWAEWNSCLNRLWSSPLFFRHYIKCGAGSPVIFPSTQYILNEKRFISFLESATQSSEIMLLSTAIQYKNVFANRELYVISNHVVVTSSAD